MRFSIFKQTKNKSYNYVPRYYDERKERLKNLEEKYRKISDDEYSSGYRRTNYRDTWKVKRNKKSDQNSRIRLIVIMVFLFFIAYIILKKSDLLRYVYG